jgi:hypothetical protein
MEGTPRIRWTPAIGPALLAALLFGASTPLAKLLVVDTVSDPACRAAVCRFWLGLGTWLFLRRYRGATTDVEAPLQRVDVPWLAGAVLFGGVIGPVLLMWAS